jgi:RNA polymerase sigma-70 factor (ECF subfamily)
MTAAGVILSISPIINAIRATDPSRIAPSFVLGSANWGELMSDAGTNQFHRQVVPHLATLFRVAWRLTRNTPDAQDLVQDTCITAWEHQADLEAATQPLHWLLRVLNNRFIDGARRRKRSPLSAGTNAVAHMISTEPNPEELLQQADGERRLERAFLQLDQAQRALLTLRAEGHDLAEIETITGIGREALRARLHRARRSLAAHLNEHTGAAPSARAGSRS